MALDDLIDPSLYKRFNRRNTVFSRSRNDPSAQYYGKNIRSRAADVIGRGESGYEGWEFIRHRAARSVCGILGDLYGRPWGQSDEGKGVTGSGRTACRGKQAESDGPAKIHRRVDEELASMGPEERRELVKSTALQFGACAAGVCRSDLRWIYEDYEGEVLDLEDYPYAIVMAVPMDPGLIRNSPAYSAETEIGWGYTRMAVLAVSMASFVAGLGYRAVPSGNETALSIPLAISAGLGSLGRNGLLLIDGYGSCIRLCKVYTDLPMVVDAPAASPLHEDCRACGICATRCPAEAITEEIEPSVSNSSEVSSVPGVRRWSVDADRCYSFWIENGGDCSSCIAACPKTPIQKPFR